MNARPSEEEDSFLECYLCGKAALYVIQLAGEDEPVREAAACEIHSRGHVHRGLLTPVEPAQPPPPPR